MRNTGNNKYILAVLTALITLFNAVQFATAQTNTAANTTISNVARGEYVDQIGTAYSALSPTVTIDVLPISVLTVSPDEVNPTDVIAANETITREFKACNNGNLTESYSLTAATVGSPSEIVSMYLDLDENGVVSSGDEQIQLNTEWQKTLEPGKCVAILVVVNTNSVSEGQKLPISITVKPKEVGAVNGPSEESGTIINTVGKNAKFTDPTDPTLIPEKLVDNKAHYISQKDEVLDYTISFKNAGDVPARNVVVTDNLPAELEFVAGTLKLNDSALTDADDGDQGSINGKVIKVSLATPVNPGQVIRVSFKAVIKGAVSSGQGIPNVAQISGDNATVEDTTAATAVVDPFGTVYAARGGEGSPIAGANIGIYSDANATTPISIPAGQGFTPNFENTNPYLTNQQGRFSFGLSPDQMGTVTAPVSYFVKVTAQGFRDRIIKITLSPTANGLFKMTVHSLDGMPVAVADGFELSVDDVDIASIADIAFNVPMFEDSLIYVNKSSDKTTASIGDLVNYRIEARNTSVAPMFNTHVKDTLPNSFSYVPGTARVQRDGKESALEPTIAGNVLDFDLGEVKSGETVNLTYRVRINANAKNGDNFNTAVVNGKFPSGEEVVSPTSRALVRVSEGIFSIRQFIIGRVYVDENGNDKFDEGEEPVPGVRVYLANGNSSTTDSKGLYSIPAVSQGSQVIMIDPITIPKGYLLSKGLTKSHRDWTRLLRTPLGGGGMLRQNFALIQDFTSSTAPSPIVKTSGMPFVAEKSTDKAEMNSAEPEFESVPAGEVSLYNLEDNSVAPDVALNLSVSAMQGWTTVIEVNGKQVSNQTIGTTRVDRKNNIVTYSYVGIGLNAGPNKIKATPISPDGTPGNSKTVTVYGRGEPVAFSFVADKNELQASGRDFSIITVRAKDKWGNPAQDGSVTISTTGGQLLPLNGALTESNDQYRNDVYDSKSKLNDESNVSNREQTVALINGEGSVKLVSDSQTGVVHLTAIYGKIEKSFDILFTSEIRPKLLDGVAELTVGKDAPDMVNRGVDSTVRGRVQVFYKGSVFGEKNMLTVAYDSQEPLNRIAGQDRLFQLNPLDQVYQTFGDNSSRFQETASNSKVYARLDRGRSYAMFGDFQTGLETTKLLGYGRKLTGAKVHIENSKGDSVTVTGARPDTSFARQVIPGGNFGLVQLGYPDILPGSEVLSLETRDRRNPEMIISREVLSRTVDYNIDTSTGTIFFLRPIPAFDRELNLVQVVATYEYRSNGNESAVYTARGVKYFENLGTKLGFSFINQNQANSKPFRLAGADVSVKLPNEGKLEFEWARSNGSLNNAFSFIGNRPSSNNEFNGDAFMLNIDQPLAGRQTKLSFQGFSASRNFFNPFGATVTPGTTRGALTVETNVLKNSTIRASFIGEKNLTDNVDNNRITAGVDVNQRLGDKLQFTFGYSFRKFTDNLSDRTVSSNLISVGADYRANDRFDISIKREQNLGSEDPSYPTQTLIGANYRFTDNAKLFFTQRLASNPITPIADVSNTGFASSRAKYETAVGVETRFGKYTSMSGRYQLENGLNGTDSFSIIGLQNRLPVNKTLSLEVGYERAFHLTGTGKGYNNFIFGANWLPNDAFRTSFRYELRDRDGFGQLYTLGAAGKFKPGWTTLGRFQYGNIDYNGRKNEVMNGELAMAVRPHDTDRYGFLVSYKHRESFFAANGETTPTELRSDLVSIDGFHQTTRRLELYGKFAAKYTYDRTPTIPEASNFTLLTQGRAQYLLGNSFDIAAEGRFMYSPFSGSSNRWIGLEGGYWATPELRIGVGYNFRQTVESYGFQENQVFNRGGFYFTVTTKISKLFDLFGTTQNGLETEAEKRTSSDSARNTSGN